MTVKKRWEHQIRGWLPQDTKPQTCSKTGSNNLEDKLGSPLRSWVLNSVKSLKEMWLEWKLSYKVRLELLEAMSEKNDHSVIARFGLASVAATFFGITYFLGRFSHDRFYHNVSVDWQVTGVILGLSFGLILGVIPTLKFLEKLAEEKKFNFAKSALLFVIFIVTACAIWMVPSIWGTNPPALYSNEYQYVSYVSSVTGLVIWVNVQFALFLGWQLKHKLKIRMGFTYYYAIQKTNNNPAIKDKNKELFT
jgi:hypothetical protein